MRIIWVALFIASLFIVWFYLKLPASAHFAERPDLDHWFDSLRSGKGMCCSFADGVALADPDVDMDGGHYRVRLDGKWIDVPDDAVVTVPNRFGSAVVWPVPYHASDGSTSYTIRCFMPGAGT